LASAKWNELSEEEKAPYNEEYKAAREVYKKEVAAYKAAHKDDDAQSAGVSEEEDKKKKDKKKKDPNAPKQPASGYLRFSTAMRPKIDKEISNNPDIPSKDVAKERIKLASAKWNELSEEEKAPYNEEYKAAREVYKKEVAAYKASLA